MSRTVKQVREFLMNFADHLHVVATGIDTILVMHPKGEFLAGSINAAGQAEVDQAHVEAHYSTPPNGWTCFHCGETFKDHRAARDHFGRTVTAQPACQINAAEYRRMEALVARYVEEDTDLHREIGRLRLECERKAREGEEKGYNRGVREAISGRDAGF